MDERILKLAHTNPIVANALQCNLSEHETLVQIIFALVGINEQMKINFIEFHSTSIAPAVSGIDLTNWNPCNKDCQKCRVTACFNPDYLRSEGYKKLR